MLTITNKRTDEVQYAVDALFKLLMPQLAPILEDPLVLQCIKEIDNSIPVMSDSRNTYIFQTPFGFITPEYFSSGTKSFILIIYRQRHPELNWIPSLDSMGNNAKEFLFKHCFDFDFPLYCTVCSIKLADTACKDINGNVTTLGAILER